MTAIYAATVILFILNFPIKLTVAACFETANKRVFGKLKIFGIKIIDFGAEAYLSGITVYFAKKRKILGVSDVKKAVSVPMIKGIPTSTNFSFLYDVKMSKENAQGRPLCFDNAAQCFRRVERGMSSMGCADRKTIWPART